MPTTEERYFAAANSCNGFVNYFDSIFLGLDRLYIIKGGPGTGKSKLLRDIAGEARNRGCEVEYYYCSADDASLDGIIVRSLGLGVLDGTAPHVREPEFPGAVEELINLGDFWNGNKLRGADADIRSLVSRKQELFSGVYAYLAAAERIKSNMRKISGACLDAEKLSGAVSRIFRTLRDGGGSRESVRFTSCVGMNGRVHFNTFSGLAGRCYIIRDRHSTSHVLLDEIRRQAEIHSHPVYIAPDPSNPDIIEEIYLPDAGVAFVCMESVTDEKKFDKIINMSRFIDETALREHKVKLRFMRHCVESLDAGVLSELTEIKAVHFKLESIYGSAMDFRRKEDFTKKLLIRIF